jgi:hypothetical protein
MTIRDMIIRYNKGQDRMYMSLEETYLHFIEVLQGQQSIIDIPLYQIAIMMIFVVTLFLYIVACFNHTINEIKKSFEGFFPYQIRQQPFPWRVIFLSSSYYLTLLLRILIFISLWFLITPLILIHQL